MKTLLTFALATLMFASCNQQKNRTQQESSLKTVSKS